MQFYNRMDKIKRESACLLIHVIKALRAALQKCSANFSDRFIFLETPSYFVAAQTTG